MSNAYRLLSDRQLADAWEERATTAGFDLTAFALETARRAAASATAYR